MKIIAPIPIAEAGIAPWNHVHTVRLVEPRSFDSFERGFIGASTQQLAGYVVNALQHRGGTNRYMEDGYLVCELERDGGNISHAQCVAVIKKTFAQIAAEIDQLQNQDAILYSGTTFSGYFIIDDLVIAIQLGDSAIFALEPDVGFKCVPLAPMHDFENPDEKKRVLLQMLSEDELAKITQKLETLGPMLSSEFYHDFSSDFISCLHNLRLQQTYTLPFNKFQADTVRLIAEILEDYKENAKKRHQVINAICCYLSNATCHLTHTGKWSRATPSRTLGNKKPHLTFAGPELFFYQRPKDTATTLMLATDGVTDVLAPKDIASYAAQSTQVDGFLQSLLYQAYDADPIYCDNLSAMSIQVSGAVHNNNVLFCGVYDGHGGRNYCHTEKHVIHYIKMHLAQRLRENFQSAISQNMQVSTSETNITNWTTLSAGLAELHRSFQPKGQAPSPNHI